MTERWLRSDGNWWVWDGTSMKWILDPTQVGTRPQARRTRAFRLTLGTYLFG